MFSNENAILENILLNPHPTDVLADSSLFSIKRLHLVRQLLIARKLFILPEVHEELLDLVKKTSNLLTELVFPDGKLNSGLELLQYPAIKNYNYVTERYTNLLHIRKRLLENRFSQYTEEKGYEPKGKDRTQIIQELSNLGVSWRTLRLANKGDPNRRYTDEIIVVYGVLSPILTGRDCFILTADKDVFDQFFQFTQLLHDDYGSYLIAEDYHNNPERYKHAHLWNTPYMQPGAITIGRELEPNYLLPYFRRTCAAWVIDVENLNFMAWAALREVEGALKFQESAADGRVGDGRNGLNVHMSLGDRDCKLAPSHFTVGRDVLAVEMTRKTGKLCFSYFDIFRAITDRSVNFLNKNRLNFVDLVNKELHG
jgi:hypothetical protein